MAFAQRPLKLPVLTLKAVNFSTLKRMLLWLFVIKQSTKTFENRKYFQSAMKCTIHKNIKAIKLFHYELKERENAVTPLWELCWATKPLSD